MGRVLLAWELGNNLGHVSRLLPLAQRLKARGHGVLVAARDVAAAGRLLGPAAIPFVQAPITLGLTAAGHQPAGYADLLAAQGWGDASSLWGLVQAWCNLVRLCRAEVVVLDYAPTALLASRAQRVPTVAVGTGFELPPSSEPLPTFPGFPGATAEAAARAEGRVLGNANKVLEALGMPKERSLADVLRVEHCFLTTFAELDHYGSRADAVYVGPINSMSDSQTFDWPMDMDRKVFAYLRTDTPALTEVLEGLAECGRRIVCYAPGVSADLCRSFQGPSFAFSDRPVRLESLFQVTDLCVSYAPAGFVTSGLLRGIPQLLSPAHVEAQLTAHRVELLGGGLVLRGPQTGASVGKVINTLLGTAGFRERAQTFARRYADSSPDAAAERITDRIESLVA